MSEKNDVLIIGAGPSGMVTALTACKYYPDKKITVIRSIEKGVVPCGIPYMFFSLKDPEENKVGVQALEAKGVKVVCDEVLKIDRKNKKVITGKGNEYGYEKLVIATGSKPIKPPIPGIDKKGVYFAYKDMNYLKTAVADMKLKKKILILGGGFIGVEFADEISKMKNVKVYLAEVM
nr:FAD-dependent oxidoreductase [Candidatus Omnitrophota bacterium]